MLSANATIHFKEYCCNLFTVRGGGKDRNALREFIAHPLDSKQAYAAAAASQNKPSTKIVLNTAPLNAHQCNCW